MTESASRSEDSDPRFSAPLREGETVAGKYVIGRLLGLGGMGAVYEARDLRLDRRVALKVLLPRLVTSKTAAGRFKREAKAATRITSEHVVKVVEIDDLHDGTPFLVMEYLEGKDLRALLHESGPLPPRRAVDYLLQALQAVAEGHMGQIIHRDLKPSNLFLSERADGTPLIKVLDFGIAKTLHADSPGDLALTSSEDIQLGSPTYMPPEQFQNPRDVDARADIWALGVTLYELISGRVPFQGLTYAELISQVLSRPPDPLRAAAQGSSLPAGLEKIVRKCLEKKREARYLNAIELAVELAPFGSDDARLSLNRVSGLSRPRTPVPTSSSPRDSSGGYEATMPVPQDALLERRHTETSSGARPVPRRSRWTRSSLALSVLAAAVLFGVLVFQRRTTPLRPAVRPVTSSLSALRPAAPLPNVAVEQPTSTVASAASAASAPTKAVQRKPLPMSPASSARPSPSASEPVSAEPNSTPSAAPIVIGQPSPQIEVLIRNRH